MKNVFIELTGELRWLPSENSSIDFWKDNWLGQPLTVLLDIPTNLISSLSGTIADFWHHGWTISPEFANLFLDIYKLISTTIPGPPDSDKLIWTRSSDGEITSKFFFEDLNNSRPELHWCRFIWHTFIPPRRSLLLWKVLHKRLATDENLKKRGIFLASRCHFCEKEEESLDHLLLRCDFSKSLWSYLATLFEKTLQFSDNFEEFFILAMKSSFSPQIRSLWIAGIFALIWEIWCSRNKKIFEGKNENIWSSKSFILASIRETDKMAKGCMKNCQEDLIILHNLRIKGRPPDGPSIIPVKWNLPPSGWIKVNIDGAARGSPGKAGCGGIFRTCRGFIKGCFSLFLGTRLAFEAEIMGFILAIEFAYKFKWKNLWVETDSTYIVALFKDSTISMPWELRNRWSRAIRYANELKTHIFHIFREGNEAADKLASWAATSELAMWWKDVPDFISRLAYRDMSPIPFYRFRN